MSGDFLKEVAQYKKERIEIQSNYYATLKKNLLSAKIHHYGIFKKAILRPGKISLIAEVKKASPSAGLIRDDFNAVAIAKSYEQNGAQAISVLTEDKYFLGKIGYLKDISDQVALPILMKDFIIHEYQIFEGVFHGASAVLLIVAMLDDEQLKDYIQLANFLGIDALVEVHDEWELDRAMKAQVDIIGVNNRNLRTLVVDTQLSQRVIPRIPKDKTIVAESGLKTIDDINAVKSAGANAVLIGETFMRSSNIADKMHELGFKKD